ncbi:glycosyltransferase [Rhizorhabdus sp.]|uniref:glycosyltransferase n=1 Tax=Rhizorhabdus sp. TaxID=1968843 RepID=UPI0025F0E428|nr:glycosyltransferase [Rhizorhabdus sp.]
MTARRGLGRSLQQYREYFWDGISATAALIGRRRRWTMRPSSPAPAPLRIAYVINSMEGGGASAPIAAITEVLRKCGAEVRVFALCRRDGRGIPALQVADIPVDVRDGAESDHLSAFRWLLARLRDYRPTLLWTSLTRATLLGQLAGQWLHLPVVSWQHAAYLKPANRRLLRASHAFSTLWVADSDVVADFTVERLGVSPQRLVSWPIFRADPAARRAAPGTQGRRLRIGSLGRLHRVKGYDTLLLAAASLRALAIDFELEIAGEGRERSALEKQAADLGLDNVVFSGFATDAQTFLASLDLYVQPSRSEGFCIAAHEAMQAGLPVIASAVGELARSISPGVTGELVPPDQPDLLAIKLGLLLNDTARLARMGEEARRQTVTRFGPSAFEAAGRAALDCLFSLAALPAVEPVRAEPLSPDPERTALSA